MATFETITKVLAVISAAYPNFDLKPETVKVYLRLLADLPDELLEEASLVHIAQSTYFPTVADLRAAVFELIEHQNPFPADLEAWSEVEDQIRRVGYTGQPVFHRPLTAQLVNAMGWQNLCRSENLVADRAHFLTANEQLCFRERSQMQLMGLETMLTKIQKRIQIYFKRRKTMTREYEIREWQDESLYFALKMRFADQAAAYYQAKTDEVDHWIVSLGIQLFAGSYERVYCRLNPAVDIQALVQAGFRSRR